MRSLSYNEKILLIILIVSTLITVYITIYLSSTTTDNNNIFVINTTTENSHEGLHEGYKYSLPDNVTFQAWNNLAKEIYDSPTYDSYILICEKSIIPYAASALSFIIENLSKPIILTEPNNLKNVYKLAKKTKIPEVSIYSNGKLLRGVRSIIDHRNNIISPHYPPLTLSNCLKSPSETMSLKFINPKISVGIINIHPGITSKDFKNTDNMKGLILDCTNSDFPKSKSFINVISSIIKKGTIIVVTNYNKIYPTIIKIGIILGYDMTINTAYNKLCFLLSNISEKKFISQIMNHNLRGEITI
jgi:L-asparaginase